MQTLTFKTLSVFFFITHARRRIVHFNVTAHPTAPWVWRQLLEAMPWGQQPRYLIRDRDRSYGGAFIYKARAIGIKTVPHCGAGTAGERHRGACGRNAQARMSRPSESS